MCQPFLLGRVIDYYSPPAVSLNSSAADRMLPPNGTQDVFVAHVRDVWSHSEGAGGPVTLQEALLYATGLLLSILLSNVLMHAFMMASFHLGMKVRVATCSLIYRKVGVLPFPLVVLV